MAFAELKDFHGDKVLSFFGVLRGPNQGWVVYVDIDYDSFGKPSFEGWILVLNICASLIFSLVDHGASFFQCVDGVEDD